MISMSSSFTVTDLIAAASDFLEGGNYFRVSEEVIGAWPTPNARIFEDEYGIVALVVYETWSELKNGWMDAQSALVDLISAHLTRSNAKAWEGYLVILTPSVSESEDSLEMTRIQYDTGRVRKLVGTGEELRTIGDVERLLFPILSLNRLDVKTRESVLDLLPGVLSQRGVPEEITRTAIQALNDHRPIIQSIHETREKR